MMPIRKFLRRALSYVYRRAVRPLIPFTERVYYASIPTCYDRKLSERLFPRRFLPQSVLPDEPRYESALIDGLHRTIRKGDVVVCYRRWHRDHGSRCSPIKLHAG
jgi:hypothetical protein